MANQEKLDDFFREIKSSLRDSDGVKVVNYYDFIHHIPMYEGSKLTKTDVQILNQSLSNNDLASYPKFNSNIINKDMAGSCSITDKPVNLNSESENFKFASLIAKTSVLMAKIDSVVDVNESDKIKELIKEINFISTQEKKYITAQSMYFLEHTPKREVVFSKFETLSKSEQEKVVEAAQYVAIADGEVDINEVTFLQDLYRAFDWNVRTAKVDMKKLAKKYHLDSNLHTPKSDVSDPIENTEVDEVLLDDLFLDFEDY
ncbi:TerB family tellurite resistance protein [Thalassomonas sp. M1454]|uniref:TerB family tellurite resistance protein n=1 Tax=Thalassomonas sp. M1454 TaxID=2594477 RepID=UPI0011800387|nr:TerB family tellurite resistance protein [Thalassomonas sp. M1454]TRX56689.1 TerB family tellurite resistance protein [Thalassomonas sp. M1454]